MSEIKINKAVKIYAGFKGSFTIRSILQNIPENLIKTLTSKQLAEVMKLVSISYNAGKSKAGAEMIDCNAVYINSINKIIEWKEEGAEYVRVDEVINGIKTNYAKKIKDGKLVAKICNYE